MLILYSFKTECYNPEKITFFFFHKSYAYTCIWYCINMDLTLFWKYGMLNYMIKLEDIQNLPNNSYEIVCTNNKSIVQQGTLWKKKILIE